MSDLGRILSLAGLGFGKTNENDVAEISERELKEYEDGCECCGGGRCKCSGDCPDCNCHGNNEWDESVEEAGQNQYDGHDIMSEDPPNGIDYDYSNLSKVNWDQYSEEDIKTFYSIVDNLDFEQGYSDTPTAMHVKALRWLEDNVLDKKAKDPVGEASKPDFLDVDGDGDREESWKDAEEDKDEMEEEVLDEAAAKIACLGCDEVSTAKAWEKNHGFCPKCKTSSQGVAESIEEAAMCETCNESECTCDDELNESPTMDTTQLVIMMRNAGLSEETIQTKLDEWANTPAGVGEVEPTAHGDAYDFAQSVNLSLKRYLDAQDMKVQVTEHTVENMKSLYEAHKKK